MGQQLTGQFVIIAGVAKCGSTSLYHYLNAHPKIVGATLKEPNYFLYPDPLRNQQYPSKWESKYLSTPIEDYYKVFPPVKHQDMYRLDGSIGYCAAPQTAHTIYSYLPHAKIIFIFRNPVDRFISMYRYQRQMYRIPSHITLDQFISGFEGQETVGERALAGGQYANLLRPYWECFDHENILLLRFSDLKNNPRRLMQSVCNFLNIDEQIYDNYNFDHHNKTQSVKSMSLDRLQFNIIMPIYRKIMVYPKLFSFVKSINRRTWYPLYEYLNGKAYDKSEISTNAREYLTDFYKDEAQLLAELTGIEGLLD